VLAVTISSALAAGATAPPARAALAQVRSASASTGWRVSLSIKTDPSTLMDSVDADSASDAWAVGRSASPLTKNGGVIEHWTGKAWHRVAPPANLLRRFNKTDDAFWAVGASSAGNVWAFSLDGKYLRLNGRRWTFGRLPHPGKTTMIVLSAKVFSPTDVWTFGCRATSFGTASFHCVPAAARFNGHGWTALRLPGKGVVWQASAVGPANIWAIDGPSVISATGSQPRVLHWNGTTWQTSSTQPKLPKGTQLTGIAATSDTNIWIGGNVLRPKTKVRGVALHWNGRSWLDKNPPSEPSGGETEMASLTPDGRGGIFELASRVKGEAGVSTVIRHYSAGRWLAPISKKNWQIVQLAEVPGTSSTWGVGLGGPGSRLALGLIVLNGPTPR
jgi:hypothetical protein